MAAREACGARMLRGISVGAMTIAAAMMTPTAFATGAAAGLQQSTSDINRILGTKPDATVLLDGGQTVRGRYVDVLPSQCSEPLGVGRRCALAVTVTPKPGFRVYAPGNTGYTAVALVLDPNGSIEADATSYPKAEEYFFAPLKERFRVYQAPFRLSRNITRRSVKGAPAAAAAATVTITGKLDYQACDDVVCYLSQTVPLAWTLPLAR
jgi:hypothetical protein